MCQHEGLQLSLKGVRTQKRPKYTDLSSAGTIEVDLSLTLQRRRQEDQREFKATLGCVERPVSKQMAGHAAKLVESLPSGHEAFEPQHCLNWVS